MSEATLPDTDSARAQAVLAQAREQFPRFELFGDFSLVSYTSHSGNQLLQFFARQDAPTRKALSACVMEHAQGKPFGEVMRFLRIVNGMTASQVAQQVLGTKKSAPRISNIETGNTDHNYTPQQFSIIAGQNIFGLSASHLEQLSGLWAKDRHNDAPTTCSAVVESIRARLGEYMAGERPLAELMTCNEALEALFHARQIEAENREKPEYKNVASLSRTLFSSQDNSYLNGIFYGDINPAGTIFDSIAEALGLDEDTRRLIKKLPFKGRVSCPQFDDAARAEMVVPEVACVFRHPERYDSAGSWLAALREAAQLSHVDITEILASGGVDISQQAVSLWERNKNRPPEKTIDALLASNAYSLPVGEDGAVSKQDGRLFAELARSGKDNWQAVLKRLGLHEQGVDWPEVAKHFQSTMKNQYSAADWQKYFTQEMAPELAAIETGDRQNETARFGIMIEDRSVGVIRQDGEAQFLREDIHALAGDRNFVRRLELRLEEIKKERCEGESQSRQF